MNKEFTSASHTHQQGFSTIEWVNADEFLLGETHHHLPKQEFTSNGTRIVLTIT